MFTELNFQTPTLKFVRETLPGSPPVGQKSEAGLCHQIEGVTPAQERHLVCLIPEQLHP